MDFRPRVLAVEPNRRFSWLGSLLARGMSTGSTSF